MSTRLILGAALAMALPLAASAHGDHAHPESLPAASAGAGDKLIVVRDAETGKLRHATGEEIAALEAQKSSLRRSARAAAVTPVARVHPSGARGVRLTDDMLSHSVMVRGADGKLVEFCFANKEEAEAALRSGVFPAAAAVPSKSSLPTE